VHTYKITSRVVSFCIVIGVSLIVMNAGVKLLQYASCLKFYTRFVLKWEHTLTLLASKEAILPHFSGSNHVDYMEQLTLLLKKKGIPVPESNTQSPYIYRLSKVGQEKNEDIFLLGMEQKIVLFGLSKPTFNMLDKKIDHTVDDKNGNFKGTQHKKSETYTGVWAL
jgi:hypothetical protein